MPQKILVLDDEENYAKMLHSLLEQHYFLVDSATKPEAALRGLEEQGYELVISDYKMPVMDGSDFLEKARIINPSLPVILVSGLMNTPELVKVANMGVTLVLEKPIDIENFLGHVKRFVQPLDEEEFYRQKHLQESASANAVGEDGEPFVRRYPEGSAFVSDRSQSMQMFLDELWRAASEQAHVFLKLPPGAEFERLLREISRWQGQPTNQLYTIDISSPVPQGMVERLNAVAGSGELSNVVGVYGYGQSPLKLQEAWVDILREAPEDLLLVHGIDARVFGREPLPINPELSELLVQSLCEMPPLSDRLSDIAAYALSLCQHCAATRGNAERMTLAPELAPLLLQYDWPGNFQQLADVLHRAVNLTDGDILGAEAVREVLKRTGEVVAATALPTLSDYLQAEQRQYLEQVLKASGQDISSVLDRMEVDLSLHGSVDSPRELGLLYPELLTAKG